MTTHGTPIFYHGRNDTDLSLTIGIGTIRYEYFFRETPILDAIEYVLKRWPRKGLNTAKRRAYKVVKQ